MAPIWNFDTVMVVLTSKLIAVGLLASMTVLSTWNGSFTKQWIILFTSVQEQVVSVDRQPRASSSVAFVDKDINSMETKHARASS